jgi:hypothetical protein
MTPKEKAKELVDSFEDDLMECDTYFLEAAKQRCALIAVNNIIDSLQIKNYPQADQYEYWNEVKQEIQKL